MEEHSFVDPITVSARDGLIHVAYDQVSVDFRESGPLPASAPLLARHVFEAVTHDLPGDISAE